MKHINPFFEKYTTPHYTIPFSKITIKDYEEAITEGIRRDNEQLHEILTNTQKPTFENTIIVEQSEERNWYFGLLDRATDAFFNLLSADSNPKMEALARKLTPILTQHENNIMLNAQLFERVKYVHQHHRKLNNEEKILLQDYYDSFVQSGALLNEKGKQHLRQITEELSLLSLQFSQNLLKETNNFCLLLTEKKDLEGLPESAIEAAKQNAKEKNKKGWVFTLHSPSYNTFMQFSTHNDLRKKMYMAYNTRCSKKNKTSNIEICIRIINLRQQLAQIIGYKNYADMIMRHRMASNTRNVYRLLNRLIKAYQPTAEKELKELKQCANSNKIEPWDMAYYIHKLQLKKYNLDGEMLRPYLKLENVIKGIFGLSTTLYGITFKENKKIDTYHKDVKAYEVFDKDGSYLAVLYADFYPRKGKQDGAWMTTFQGQSINSKGENIRPHISLVMNFTKPTAKKPSLLTLSEVETFLHEFGHALHEIFANTKYESQSGTNVWWDFVELPSQLMENYAIEKRFLQTFATHFQSGEMMPDSLIKRIVKSRNFNVARACLQQVSYALLDMTYHTQQEEFTDDIFSLEKKIWEHVGLPKQALQTCLTTQFSHIISGGYAAGYYSYKWAEVLEADVFAVFKRYGIFNEKIAQRFRQQILSKGGTEHPMTLYKNFKGSEPTIDALLKRNGIKTSKTR